MYRLSAGYETRSEPRLSTLLYEILVTLMQNSEPLHGSVPLEIRHSIRLTADRIYSECERPWTLESMADLPVIAATIFFACSAALWARRRTGI